MIHNALFWNLEGPRKHFGSWDAKLMVNTPSESRESKNGLKIDIEIKIQNFESKLQKGSNL